MKLSSIIKPLLVALLPFMGTEASASNYTGLIASVISQPSPSTSGNIRVSIIVRSAPASYSCSSSLSMYYSYDLPDGIVAKTWVASLLAAITSERSVTIGGTGACDSYGIETVASVYVF